MPPATPATAAPAPSTTPTGTLVPTRAGRDKRRLLPVAGRRPGLAAATTHSPVSRRHKHPDGRAARILVSHLTSHKPLSVPEPSELEIPDKVPWGIRYHRALQIPDIPVVPAGD